MLYIYFYIPARNGASPAKNEFWKNSPNTYLLWSHSAHILYVIADNRGKFSVKFRLVLHNMQILRKNERSSMQQDFGHLVDTLLKAKSVWSLSHVPLPHPTEMHLMDFRPLPPSSKWNKRYDKTKVKSVQLGKTLSFLKFMVEGDCSSMTLKRPTYQILASCYA